MEIITSFLKAVVSAEEFNAGVGAEYNELYIVAPDGKMFIRQKLSFGREVIIPVNKIPGLAPASPYLSRAREIKSDILQFFPNGRRVPKKYFYQVLAFFREFMKNNPTAAAKTNAQHSYEAMAHIVWSPERGYRVAIPTQTVSGASVSYTWDHIHEDEEVIVDIHSHNTMGAFFSGTDNGDDRNKISVSGVIGQLDKPEFATCWRFNHGETKITMTLAEVFVDEDADFTVPKDWIDRVTVGASYGAGYSYGRELGNGFYTTVRGNRGHMQLPHQGRSLLGHAFEDDFGFGEFDNLLGGPGAGLGDDEDYFFSMGSARKRITPFVVNSAGELTRAIQGLADEGYATTVYEAYKNWLGADVHTLMEDVGSLASSDGYVGVIGAEWPGMLMQGAPNLMPRFIRMDSEGLAMASKALTLDTLRIVNRVANIIGNRMLVDNTGAKAPSALTIHERIAELVLDMCAQTFVMEDRVSNTLWFIHRDALREISTAKALLAEKGITVGVDRFAIHRIPLIVDLDGYLDDEDILNLADHKAWADVKDVSIWPELAETMITHKCFSSDLLGEVKASVPVKDLIAAETWLTTPVVPVNT